MCFTLPWLLLAASLLNRQQVGTVLLLLCTQVLNIKAACGHRQGVICRLGARFAPWG